MTKYNTKTNKLSLVVLITCLSLQHVLAQNVAINGTGNTADAFGCHII